MAIPTLEADPCARAAALRLIYDQLITGGVAVEAEFEAVNGVRRRVKYSEANLALLQAAIGEAAAACAGAGTLPRRFAIGGRMNQ